MCATSCSRAITASPAPNDAAAHARTCRQARGATGRIAGMMRFMLAVVTGVGLGGGGAYAVHAMQTRRRSRRRPMPSRPTSPRAASSSGSICRRAIRWSPIPICRQGCRAHRRHRGRDSASAPKCMCARSAITTPPRTISIYDAVLSVRSRPEQVAAEVQQADRRHADAGQSGKWHAQNHTNILAFLDNVSQSIGCAGMPTTIILASDGIEDSEYAHLARAGRSCPRRRAGLSPAAPSFEILGLGQGTQQPDGDRAPAPGLVRLGKGGRIQAIPGLNDW